MSINTIMLATSKVDITPRMPVALAGYGFREGPFESVHTPLELRCFIFSYPQQDVVLLSADLLWWGRDTIVEVQKKIEDCLPGIDRKSILFLATHNHCGPQVSFQFSSQLGACDSSYFRFLADQVIVAIKAAQQNQHRVAAKLFNGETDISINRRKTVDSSIQMAPNPQGPRDTALRLIDFVAVENGPLFQSGQSVAVLACAACHPTSSADNQVDQEFLSRGVSKFASTLSTDTLGCFVQGCCGDTRPNLVANGSFVRGSLDVETEQLATQFARDIQTTHQSKGTLLSFSIARPLGAETISLDYQSDFRRQLDREPATDVTAACRVDEAELEWDQHFSKVCKTDVLPLGVNYFRLSQEFQLLFFSDEMVTEYALFVQRLTQGRVWCGSYCGGVQAYVGTAQQIQEGGYETEGFIYYFLCPAPLDIGIEKVIKKRITEIIHD